MPDYKYVTDGNKVMLRHRPGLETVVAIASDREWAKIIVDQMNRNLVSA